MSPSKSIGSPRRLETTAAMLALVAALVAVAGTPAFAAEAAELAEHVLETSAAVEEEQRYTPELFDTAASVMREVLEREDHLAARAKDALVAARKAAQQGAGAAADAVTGQALAVAEMTRAMRTRTRTALASLSEAANNLGDAGGEALSHAQEELTARVKDGRAFAARVLEQARNLIEK